MKIFLLLPLCILFTSCSNIRGSHRHYIVSQAEEEATLQDSNEGISPANLSQ